MSAHKCYLLSTLSGRKWCREIYTHIKLTHEVFFWFLSCSPRSILQKDTLCISEFTLCFREAPSSAVLLLRTISSAHWCLLMNTCSVLLFRFLRDYLGNTWQNLVHQQRWKGGWQTRKLFSLITLFSCLSLLSVIWDYQKLDYSIFRGCCEEKASRKKRIYKNNLSVIGVTMLQKGNSFLATFIHPVSKSFWEMLSYFNGPHLNILI